MAYGGQLRHCALCHSPAMSRCRWLWLCLSMCLAAATVTAPGHEAGPSESPKDASIRYILMWIDNANFKQLDFNDSPEPFRKLNCPVSACVFTTNHSLLPLEEFDAVVVHVYRLTMNDVEELVRRRTPRQRYIFYSVDPPPYNIFPAHDLRGFFNWTMTFRLDSDLPMPFGVFLERDPERRKEREGERVWAQPPPEQRPLAPQEFERRLRDGTLRMPRRDGAWRAARVAWLVSHCKTMGRREELVRCLDDHMGLEVHVFGLCGGDYLQIPMKGFYYNLYEHRYDFYLAFENSFCRDYATEKFFNTIDLNVIPVVYGGANYSAIAPPFSYINVLDFSSLNALASYMEYLANQPAEFDKYKWWRDMYYVDTERNEDMCRLCERLHEHPEGAGGGDDDEGDGGGDGRGEVKDVERWWLEGGRACWQPQLACDVPPPFHADVEGDVAAAPSRAEPSCLPLLLTLLPLRALPLPPTARPTLC